MKFDVDMVLAVDKFVAAGRSRSLMNSLVHILSYMPTSLVTAVRKSRLGRPW